VDETEVDEVVVSSSLVDVRHEIVHQVGNVRSTGWNERRQVRLGRGDVDLTRSERTSNLPLVANAIHERRVKVVDQFDGYLPGLGDARGSLLNGCLVVYSLADVFRRLAVIDVLGPKEVLEFDVCPFNEH